MLFTLEDYRSHKSYSELIDALDLGPKCGNSLLNYLSKHRSGERMNDTKRTT